MVEETKGKKGKKDKKDKKENKKDKGKKADVEEEEPVTIDSWNKFPRELKRRFLQPGDIGVVDDVVIPVTDEDVPPPVEEEGKFRAIDDAVEVLPVASQTSLATIFQTIASFPNIIPDRGFLWEPIYPKLSDGRPAVSASGKYVLRLFHEGAWRRVVVDDRMPVDASGWVPLVRSESPREIWTMLLAKGLYKLLGSELRAEDAFMALTGWIAESTELKVDEGCWSTLVGSTPHSVPELPRQVVVEMSEEERLFLEEKAAVEKEAAKLRRKKKKRKSPTKRRRRKNKESEVRNANSHSSYINNTVAHARTLHRRHPNHLLKSIHAKITSINL